MKKIALSAAALLLASAGASAYAADLSYTYVQLAYTNLSHDNLTNGDGYQLDGSFELPDQFFVNGGYEYQTFTPGYANSAYGGNEFHRVKLGGGWYTSMTDSTDFIVRLGAGSGHSSFGNYPTNSDSGSTGYDAGIGIRSLLNPHFELSAALDHDNVGFYYSYSCTPLPFSGQYCLNYSNGSATETVISAGARFYFGQLFSLGLDYRKGSNQGVSDFLLSGRFSF